MSWRNAEKIEFLGGRRNNSGLPQAKETHTLNKINDICDFSRYEKSSSMKRPTLKVVDFDSVVQNTKSSKSTTFNVGLF